MSGYVFVCMSDTFFADRPVQEIVALLSCLVFQQRNCSEPGGFLTTGSDTGREVSFPGANPREFTITTLAFAVG
jgi:hypothetical protein